MLKILAAIVLSSSLLIAKDVPINKILTVVIPNNEWSVLEFPFKITGKDTSPFKRRIKQRTAKKEIKKYNENKSSFAPILKYGAELKKEGAFKEIIVYITRLAIFEDKIDNSVNKIKNSIK